MFYSPRKTSGFHYLEIIYSYYIHFYWLKPKLLTMVYKALHNLTPTYLSPSISDASPPCSLHLQTLLIHFLKHIKLFSICCPLHVAASV